jgi:hypothetical protein
MVLRAGLCQTAFSRLAVGFVASRPIRNFVDFGVTATEPFGATAG